MCESFEGSNNPGTGCTDSRWTERDDGANCVITYSASHPGTFDCAGKGDEATTFAIASSSSNSCGLYIDNALSMTDYWVEFSFYFTGVSGNADTETVDLFITRNDTSDEILLRLYFDDPNFVLYLYHKDEVGNSETTTSPTIVANTWYRVKLWHDAGCGSNGAGDEDCIQWWLATNDGAYSEIEITDDSVRSGTTTDAIIAEGWLDDPQFAVTLTVDNLIIDDDTEPSVCDGS